MKREPSIHITRTQLKSLFNRFGVDVSVDDFLAYAKKTALNSRSILVSSKQIDKKVNNILLADTGDAYLVADIIYATRIKLKHRGVRKINETQQREWTNCKKLAQICNIFCKDFQLETREGFIKYIKIGISKMNNARNLVQRLISMQEVITETYVAQKEYMELSSKDKKIIKDMHDYYVKKIADKTGILESFEKDMDKYQYFIQLYHFLKDRDWLPNYPDYITAQFEGLSWCNGIPELSSLTNDKSIARYNKYLYKFMGKESESDEEEGGEGSLWDKIK
mgnify:CR=1 FL=1|jgi:hypothetical protein